MANAYQSHAVQFSQGSGSILLHGMALISICHGRADYFT